MAKVIIIYESKYGNTKLVAEMIIEGMREVSGIETVISELKDVELNKLTKFEKVSLSSKSK